MQAHRLFHYTRKLKAVCQYRFRKDIELCMISLDGGSNVVHDSPPFSYNQILAF